MSGQERTPQTTSEGRPSHLVPLSAGWSLWRRFQFRATGFPLSYVTSLAATACATAVDELQSALPPGRRTPRDLDHQLAAKESIRTMFEDDAKRVSQLLRDVARTPLFREAVAWQNPEIVAAVLDKVANADPDDHRARTRRRESIVAKYVQRLCTKNETISFMGPFSWGTFVNEAAAVSFSPTEVISKREVFLTSWLAEGMARALRRAPGIEEWLIPRRAAHCGTDGASAWLGDVPVEGLSPLELRLLGLADGTRRIGLLAEELGEDVSRAYEAFERLEGLEAVLLHPLIVNGIGRPFECALVQWASSIGNEATRAHVLGALQRVEDGRRDVALAAGNAEAIIAAQGRLAELVEREFGMSARRNAGMTYGLRTPLWEDCVREHNVTLGPEVVARLGGPLSLVLLSLRWHSLELANAMNDAVLSLLRTSTPDQGGGRIAFLPFAAHLLSTNILQEVAAKVDRDYQSRWKAILAARPEESHISRRSSDLKADFERLFSAPMPGTPNSRWHSPDILIGAKDADAFRRGEFTLVIGEMVPSFCSHAQERTVRAHPDLDELVHAIDSDQPLGLVETVCPVYGTKRVNLVIYDVEFSPRAPGKTVLAADLWLEERDGRAVLGSTDGAHEWDISFALADYLTPAQESIPWAKEAHRPRITIDDLVVSRETWNVSAEDVPFAQYEDRLATYAGVRRWIRSSGIPRFAFYKVPGEVKPCYVDFESPILVDLFAKSIRTADNFWISEMLPTPDETWFTSPDGDRHTCEIRMVVVDSVPWRSPGAPPAQPAG